MKEKTSNRLKQIMNERNMKQVDILNRSLPFQKSLDIKMGKSTLSQYVNDIQSPDQDRIYLLAKTLNVSETWLMGFDTNKYKADNIIKLEDRNFTNYNYYDTALSAGMLTEVDPFTRDDVQQVALSDVIMGKYAGDKDIFISRINGESMNKIIPDGSLIAIKKYDSLQELCDEDIVVFQDGGEMSIKRFSNNKTVGIITFSPDSSDTSFQPIVYRYEDIQQVNILGRVVMYTVTM